MPPGNRPTGPKPAATRASEPMTIVLPIPDRRISPNAQRGQSKFAAFKKSRLVKVHRTRARLLTLEAIGHLYLAQGRPVPAFTGYTLAHFFPSAAWRDDDNADAACKAYRDGIADALGMDDRQLPKLALSTRSKDAERPRVEITLHPISSSPLPPAPSRDSKAGGSGTLTPNPTRTP
jgi:crossover junction endodeoxyribonuclease RusA